MSVGCGWIEPSHAGATSTSAGATSTSMVRRLQRRGVHGCVRRGGHWCGLRSDRTITCWGDNEHGQATAPAGEFVAVSTGESHSCGLRSDRTITCWGDNEDGQATAPAGEFLAVSTGEWRSCGLRIDRTVTCWPDNSVPRPRGHLPRCLRRGRPFVWAQDRHNDRLLGRGVTASGINNWNYPSADRFTALGGESSGYGQWRDKADRTILCWGEGNSRPATGEFTAISGSCGVRVDGTVTCWSTSSDGPSYAPEGDYTAVTGTAYRGCAIAADDTITCWDNRGDRPSTVTAPAGEFMAVSVGYGHWCGLRLDRTITCWGENRYGEATAPAGEFVAVSHRHILFVWAAVGSDHHMLGRQRGWSGDSTGGRIRSYLLRESAFVWLRPDRTITCWGKNHHGQATAPAGEFVAVSTGAGAIRVGCGRIGPSRAGATARQVNCTPLVAILAPPDSSPHDAPTMDLPQSS